MNKLNANIQQKSLAMKAIKIPCLNNCIKICAHDIIRIEAASNYSKVYLVSGKIMVVTKVLQWFEESLPSTIFLRVHRSHLINMHFVKAIKGSGTIIIIMDNGEYVIVSRRKKEKLMSVLKNKY